ncbi:Uncharacterised protein [Sphingobacterium thalpophilum]|uniref:Uncharacterized protein n=1 Tax=Sphingobacterium thalpophilum TaxID=259 RepID=A0A4U9U9D6_9SPHI|nr:Uncharacterised protein [Sphingobacterium thalpophilum]
MEGKIRDLHQNKHVFMLLLAYHLLHHIQQ